LAENPNDLGQDNNHEKKDVKYWVDNFRIYSQGNFGGSDLLNFAADKNYFGGCSGEEKELIVKILQLYTHLINGYLIVPQGDLVAVEKRLKDFEEKGKANDPLAYFDDKLLTGDISAIEPIPVSTTKEAPVARKKNISNIQADGIKKIDAQMIKKIVMSEFGYTEGDQFEDVEAVIQRLQELAVDYENPEIADLYYFDEQGNEFKWREQL
jgi:hypothetical protein